MTTSDLDPMERLLAERSCERLILEFVRRLDLGEPSTVCDLFTPDGVWEWPHGQRRIEGRDALREYFGSRPVDRLSRRMCTNILVTIDSRDTATATTYFATYRVDGHVDGTLVAPRLPANIGHYQDTFREIDGSWLLAKRTLVLPFGGPTEHLGSPDRS
ncbi:nuclear transport factor 2 family protein [Streptomyces scabiei]|uniref:nuclear transport factor 2 family protein n=1 Tax=Streptomyces scabiei TaxID=1930 RepID=UPI0029B2A54E|nr:nuclear transport factor 2 family protein [Streptomyces scabiei]MDX3520587.1 nuclear transport factor 2 family protein [Streptomyces scabiei]